MLIFYNLKHQNSQHSNHLFNRFSDFWLRSSLIIYSIYLLKQCNLIPIFSVFGNFITFTSLVFYFLILNIHFAFNYTHMCMCVCAYLYGGTYMCYWCHMNSEEGIKFIEAWVSGNCDKSSMGTVIWTSLGAILGCEDNLAEKSVIPLITWLIWMIWLARQVSVSFLNVSCQSMQKLCP